jgi:hypothetical protein
METATLPIHPGDAVICIGLNGTDGSASLGGKHVMAGR